MRAILASLFGVTVVLGGCVTPDTKYSQVELNALQTREFDYGPDATFDAAINAMFDAGYVVSESDKRAGFLRGSRYSGGPMAANGGVVQIKVDQAGVRRTSVRVSTSDGGQAHVDKARIDELLNLIERRLTGGEARPTTSPGTGTKP